MCLPTATNYVYHRLHHSIYIVSIDTMRKKKKCHHLISFNPQPYCFCSSLLTWLLDRVSLIVTTAYVCNMYVCMYNVFISLKRKYRLNANVRKSQMSPKRTDLALRPRQSSSRNVHMYVCVYVYCVYVPLPCKIFDGLSLTGHITNCSGDL